jgi:hypothetical protein
MNDIHEMLDAVMMVVDDADAPFNDWERNFIISIHERLKKADLSQKQIDTLTNIYEKYRGLI